MAYRFHIIGVVQGVGFRPYIYNACIKAGLTGFVQNIGSGVLVEVSNREKFEEILEGIPPLARIDKVEVSENKKIYKDFVIKKSSGKGFAEIPPDLFLCEDCYRDLKDKKNRRYGYFFTTCTNCGPRFSMTRENPYDRQTTAMSEFPMCDECRVEYENPKDRRYHAQTIACPECGPKLELWIGGKLWKGKDLIKKTVELLKNDEIVAIKGVGGFHLACNTKAKTVAKLREITKRKDKPYALMCRDLAMTRQIAKVSEKEAELLESIQRPIVVLSKTKKLEAVSELDSLGIILPYTALHYLIMDEMNESLVMTSSNMSGEPISTEKNQQVVRNVLDHSREIINSVDDSVVKVIAGKTFYLRRSRGWVPQSIFVGDKSDKQILALGAEMNSTFAIYRDGRVFNSQYIGNISNVKVFDKYKKTIEDFLEFTKTKPKVIICDGHTGYNSSIYGQELSEKWDVPLVKVQHHLAHAYSVVLENDLSDFSAIVADGLGYGKDGMIWGGEVFDRDKRVGHLEQQVQVGGDSATINIAKMLFSILRKLVSVSETKKYMRGFYSFDQLKMLDKQIEQKLNSPVTSSCGRILDSAAFLLDLCDERTYEGRPAIILDSYSTTPYKLDPVIKERDGMKVLMTTPIFEFLIKNMNKDKFRLAATVQRYLAEGLYEIASETGKEIVFSGGCSYSRVMSEFMINKEVRTNEKVPAGDGGIAFGQIGWYLANS